MCELDSAKHGFFAHAFRAGFHHHDAFYASNHHDVDRALRHLGVSRVGDELTIDLSHADRAYRAVERDIGNGQRGAGAVDGSNVRIVFVVSGHDERNDLRLISERLREQRTDRTVDHAAYKDLALAGAAFTLDEASGDSSTGVGVFAVVNGERE